MVKIKAQDLKGKEVGLHTSVTAVLMGRTVCYRVSGSYMMILSCLVINAAALWSDLRNSYSE